MSEVEYLDHFTDSDARWCIGIEDFKELVRGKVLRAKSPQGKIIEIAISDIGWLNMIAIIEDIINKGS